MSLYQASIRLRHECPYRELSDQFPDLTIREWYLSDCQVLEMTSQRAPSEELVAAVEELGTVLHRSEDEAGLHVVTQACLCPVENSIVNRFERHNCLYQPPTIHRQGWEQYNLVAFQGDDIRALHAELEADREIEVISKMGLEKTTIPHGQLTPVDQLFGDLTDRQLAALHIAIDNGYYQEPRESSIAELAAQSTVARSTFEEHLRKAENKVLGSVGRFTRLLTESQGDEQLRKGSGASTDGYAD